MTAEVPAPPNGRRVEALLSTHRASRYLSFESGARAVACDDQLELISSEGQLIACFDTSTGALVLHSTGDLTLLTSGKLKLRSAEALELDAPVIRQQCKTFELQAEQATLEATSWRLQAQRIIERSTDVYRRVERVCETRAQTLRCVARHTLSLLAERSSIISREETRVEGKRVLLG